ncbi:MAG: ethylbenzene dehydrogenase-related protein [Candidatus Polarisedimenticolaceae bacterium]|nr:ethylbenzene dehydrogenase-related protein [Candidatus Polarisedimenticolaceae bacterium]
MINNPRKMALLLMFLPLFSTALLAEYSAIDGKPPVTQRVIAEGEHQYRMRCARCHGEKGDGHGSVAKFLDPRPRDFTMGMFKFRTTATGALPTDDDLFRTITRGIPGTAMPSWQGLPEELRWALIYYIKTFAEDFSDPELAAEKSVIILTAKVASSPESIAKGEQLFQRNKCWECHGNQLRGDGRTNLKNDWGHPTRVPNLRYRWNFKGGSNAENIIYRFIAGLNGTAMPSYEDSITGDDRWHLANYLVSQAEDGFKQDMIFKVEPTTAPIPLDLDAEIWRTVAATPIFLQGQTILQPAWVNNAVTMLEVRALYNDNEIGFLIEWDDPAEDRVHHPNREVKQFQDQYVKVFGEIPREPGIFRDAIALQFPLNAKMGRVMPPFLGSPNRPVMQWLWQSDRADRVEEAVLQGIQRPIQRRQDADQQVRSRARWSEGRWRMVMIRPLATDGRHDVKFSPGSIIPIAFNAWDGSNGEHGMVMGLSTWHLLYLDQPGSELFNNLQSMLWFFDVSRTYAPR